ncbi:MAG: MFS transporter, partial [Deltaproteobacteria bacterium]|nr:MFS transporter [Deltaproteobacteria bacterium]
MGFNRGIRGAYAVFYVALFQAFGWSRGVTATALSISVLVEGFSMPLAGSLVDRWGSRKTLVLGGLLLAAGLGFSGTVSSLWQLYVWVGVVTALGLGLMGMVPHVAIIARQFTKRRGLAMGLAWAGGGLGIAALLPVTQLLVDVWGWRLAYVGMGALAFLLVVLPSGVLMPRDKPVPRKTVAQAADAGEWTVWEALTSAMFWLLFVSRVVASMGNQVITNHQVAHAIDIGYTPFFAASVLGLMGVFSIFGRVLFGYLTDVLSHQMVYTLVQAVSSAGILALVAADSTEYPVLLYAYAACYGLGQGS